jgi:importin subunit beta-1
MAGATCLEAMARTIEDAIVPLILPFVTTNIQNSQWRLKEAAIMAFGSILDGPTQEKLVPIVGQAMSVLITCLKDETPMVRDTTAWTIGKICEYHKAAVTQEMLQPMLEGLSLALTDQSPKVASQACYAIHSLGEACGEEKDLSSNVLSQFMPFLFEKLLAVTNREDWDCENLRASAYEAVNMLVTNSAEDMRAVVVQLLTEALNRLELTFSPSFDTSERMNLQSLICSLIGVCAQKLSSEELAPLADRIIQLLLQVFNTKGAIAHEDAFMSIGFMADKLGEGLERYMSFLQPVILMGLKNVEEYQVCTVCVGVVGDLCRSLHSGLARYCDEIMRCLLELLQSPIINRSG